MLAEIIDGKELHNDKRMNIYEEGVTRIVQAAVHRTQVVQEIKLDAAAAARLVHAFQLKNRLKG